jgi:hypothetical protein
VVEAVVFDEYVDSAGFSVTFSVVVINGVLSEGVFSGVLEVLLTELLVFLGASGVVWKVGISTELVELDVFVSWDFSEVVVVFSALELELEVVFSKAFE